MAGEARARLGGGSACILGKAASPRSGVLRPLADHASTMSQVDAENVDVRSLDEALGENASEKASVPKTSAAEHEDVRAAKPAASMPAAGPSTTLTEETIDRVWDMFPKLKRDTISDVLHSKRGNVDAGTCTSTPAYVRSHATAVRNL